MHNSLAKDLYQALPLKSDQMTVRPCTRADLDCWPRGPRIPGPTTPLISAFALSAHRNAMRSLSTGSGERIGSRWCAIMDRMQPSATSPCFEIDWQSRAAGNMSLRVHPDWCGKGIGTTYAADGGRVVVWPRHAGIAARRSCNQPACRLLLPEGRVRLHG